jgi:hypothetical protein
VDLELVVANEASSTVLAQDVDDLEVGDRFVVADLGHCTLVFLRRTL